MAISSVARTIKLPLKRVAVMTAGSGLGKPLSYIPGTAPERTDVQDKRGGAAGLFGIEPSYVRYRTRSMCASVRGAANMRARQIRDELVAVGNQRGFLAG